MAMPEPSAEKEQTIWEHLNVSLPPMPYGNLEVSGQGKGSTQWAAHSHTPIGVEAWDGFEAAVAAEGLKSCSLIRMANIEFGSALGQTRLKTVKKEEDVTDNLERLLEVFSTTDWGLSGGVDFPKTAQHILANPDIIAERQDQSVWGVGSWGDYESPPPGQRAAVRRRVATQAEKLYIFPFETKPAWKFNFLDTDDSHLRIIREWEIPEKFDAESMRDEKNLPSSWSSTKKKIFHVVRQLYGQMTTDKRRYGILHIYERWFFCCRTEEGIFKISPSFRRTQTSPSIFQGIKTLLGFKDHVLENTMVHPSSATKAPAKKKPRSRGGYSRNSSKGRLPPSNRDSDEIKGKGLGGGGAGGANAALELENIASTIRLWECSLFDSTDTVHLLTTRQNPSIIVKLQRDPHRQHVAHDMAREAEMYMALSGNKMVQPFIPRFFGHSTHLGVALTCLEKELDDFDDIGLENISETVKQSAVCSVVALSSVGVLHNDIALRNFVVSKEDPNRAKIIDFGRASISNDSKRLAEQVEDVKVLLGVEGMA